MAGITTRTMTLEGGLPAFLAMPATLAAPAPGIVLMHERYGFVQHTRDLAERFAQEGFVCIAPDCFFPREPLPCFPRSTRQKKSWRSHVIGCPESNARQASEQPS